MEPERIRQEICRLSVAQRLLLAQDIWDSIARESSNLPIADWQKNELSKRYEQYSQGERVLYDCDDVHARLRAKVK
jgi:putative addiction module component (TIGR02574 family)